MLTPPTTDPVVRRRHAAAARSRARTGPAEYLRRADAASSAAAATCGTGGPSLPMPRCGGLRGCAMLAAALLASGTAAGRGDPMNAAVTTVETDTIARMLRLGCQLIRLAPGVKTPKGGESWKLNPTITTVGEALDWVAAGGGLGVDSARSGMICLDAEDKAATTAVVDAGLAPDVITAKGQVDGNPKQWGSHAWFRGSRRRRSVHHRLRWPEANGPGVAERRQDRCLERR